MELTRRVFLAFAAVVLARPRKRPKPRPTGIYVEIYANTY